MKRVLLGLMLMVGMSQQVHAGSFFTEAQDNARSGLRPVRSGRAAERAAKASENAAKAVPWLVYLDDEKTNQLRRVDMPLDADPQTAAEYSAAMVDLPRDRSDYARELTVPRPLASYLVPKFGGAYFPAKFKIPGKDDSLIFVLPGVEPTRENYKTGWVTWHKLLQLVSVDELRKLIMFPVAVRSGDRDYYSFAAVLLNTDAGYTGAYNLRAFWRQALVSEEANAWPTRYPHIGPRIPGTQAPVIDTAPTFRPEFSEFYKALFAGDVAGCRRAVNAAITDAALAALKQQADASIRQLVPSMALPAPVAAPERSVTW